MEVGMAGERDLGAGWQGARSERWAGALYGR